MGLGRYIESQRSGRDYFAGGSAGTKRQGIRLKTAGGFGLKAQTERETTNVLPSSVETVSKLTRSSDGHQGRLTHLTR